MSPAAPRPHRLVVVTGTGTGVGKTVFTALFTAYLRSRGHVAAAMKPLCSGSREDIQVLHAAQAGALSEREVGPWFFPLPLAPGVAASEAGVKLSLQRVKGKIEAARRRWEWLLVEGAGGLYVPGGRDFMMIDLFRAIAPSLVVLVGVNRLGVINHVLLSVEALRKAGMRRMVIVLMGERIPDWSSKKNAEEIQKWGDVSVLELPFFHAFARKNGVFREAQKNFKNSLARVSNFDSLITLSGGT